MKESDRISYSDLEQLLFRGFIQQRAKIGSLNIVFKSVSLKEIELIEALCPFDKGDNYAHVFSRLYTAHSIYVLEGDLILEGDRRKFIKDWALLLEDFPDPYLKLLLQLVNELSQRAREAFKLVEPYSFEDVSRYYWRAYDGKNLNSFEVSGVPGAEKLSFNEHQLYWTVLNRTEDRNIQYENDWSFAKFIASATNPKGISKVENSDKARKKAEQERREQLKRGLVNREHERVVKVGAWSAEDLQKQMLDWVGGRKDLHDQLMEEFEGQQKQLWDQRRDELKVQADQRRLELERENTEEPLKLIPVGKDAIQKMVAERLKARSETLSRMPNQQMMDPEAETPKIFRYHAADAVTQKADVSPTYQQPPVPQPERAPQPPQQVDTAAARNPRMAQYTGVQEMKRKAEEQKQQTDGQKEMITQLTQIPNPKKFVPVDSAYVAPVQRSADGVTRTVEKHVHGGKGLIHADKPEMTMEPSSLDPQAQRNRQFGVGTSIKDEKELAVKGEISGEQIFDAAEVERLMRERGLKK